MNEDNIRLCFEFMAVEDENLSPEARYFLVRMLYFYGLTPVDLKSQNLGISDTVFKHAKTILVRNKYLEKNPSTKPSVSLRGRPKEAFVIRPKWQRRQNTFTSEVKSGLMGLSHYKHLIHALLFENEKNQSFPILTQAGRLKTGLSESDRKQFSSAMIALKKNTLSPANRILLATLYVRADACGVVRDLGSADLLRLTGMRRERLDAQFDKLKRMGYLLERVAGMTGAYALGRVESVFYLNSIDQTELAGGKYHSTLLMCDSDGVVPYIVQLPFQLIRKYGAMMRGFLNKNGVNEHEDGRYIHYLQYKFCEFASDLLTKYWNSIDGVTMPDYEDLKSRIRDEIYPESLIDSKNDDSLGAPSKKGSVEEIYKLVFRVAFFYKTFIEVSLKKYEDASLILDGIVYLIIAVSPVINSKIPFCQKYRWAILIRSNNPIFSNSVIQMSIPYGVVDISDISLHSILPVDIVSFFKKNI
jgi:hypothetical protein